jgi:hypothetical protein
MMDYRASRVMTPPFAGDSEAGPHLQGLLLASNSRLQTTSVRHETIRNTLQLIAPVGHSDDGWRM